MPCPLGFLNHLVSDFKHFHYCDLEHTLSLTGASISYVQEADSLF